MAAVKFGFRSYPDITNDDASHAWVDKIRDTAPRRDERFLVSEKVHGCNFQLTTDGATDRVGSRNQFAGTPDACQLFSCGDFTPTLGPLLKALWEALRSTTPDMVQLTVFGELAGGAYAGMPTTGHVIQTKGPQYAPYNFFYAFDVVLDVAAATGGTDRVYLSASVARDALISAGFLAVPVLFSGTLNECLAWSEAHLRDDTGIPAWLNSQSFLTNNGERNAQIDLTPHEGRPRLREGHVIKPEETRFIKQSRCIVKCKNHDFEGDTGAQRVRQERGRAGAGLNASESEVLARMSDKLTDDRLSSVLGKHGWVSPRDAPHQKMVVGLVIQDLMHEMEREPADGLEAAYLALPEARRKTVMKQALERAARALVESRDETVPGATDTM